MLLFAAPVAPLEPTICRKPAAAQERDQAAEESSGLSLSERYMDLVSSCAGEQQQRLRHGLLISRVQPDAHKMEWRTLARVWEIGAGAGGAVLSRRANRSSAGQPRPLLPPDYSSFSHNAASLCVNGTLHIFGGQYKCRGKACSTNHTGVHRGIFHTSAPLAAVIESLAAHSAAPVGQPAGQVELSSPSAASAADAETSTDMLWSPRKLQLTGTAAGCVEKRHDFAGAGCEFDGKLSVVYFNGRFLLFARANLGPNGGARHVQMASADASLTSWTPFRVVQLPGIHAGAADSNLYFFAVQTLQLASGQEVLLGLCPGIFPTDHPNSNEVAAWHGQLETSYIARKAAMAAEALKQIQSGPPKPRVQAGLEAELKHDRDSLESEERYEAGVYASISADGFSWSRPQRLLRTPHYGCITRTRIHPVRLEGDSLL